MAELGAWCVGLPRESPRWRRAGQGWDKLSAGRRSTVLRRACSADVAAQPPATRRRTLDALQPKSVRVLAIPIWAQHSQVTGTLVLLCAFLGRSVQNSKCGGYQVPSCPCILYQMAEMHRE